MVVVFRHVHQFPGTQHARLHEISLPYYAKKPLQTLRSSPNSAFCPQMPSLSPPLPPEKYRNSRWPIANRPQDATLDAILPDEKQR